MTQPSSERLARVLADNGLQALAIRAMQDEFHDFQSPHELPEFTLVAELRKVGAEEMAQRVIDGEFDATKEESDAWAASPDGQAAMAEFPPELRRELFGI